MLILEELNEQGQLYKDKVYHLLYNKISKFIAFYERIEQEDKAWKKLLQIKILKLELFLEKKQIEFYENKNWISEEAENALSSKIDSILAQL